MIPVDTVIIGIKASCQPFFEAISSAIAVVTDFGKVAWNISSGSPKTFPNIYKIAAPQVGVSKRVFVCDDGNGVVRKVINPIVVPLTEETQEFEEGCLSVPGIYKKVERPKRVLLKYLNENGEEVEEIAENFLAVVVQHENDHLDGILFVEKISPMAKRLIAKKLANIKKETKRIKEENE